MSHLPTELDDKTIRAVKRLAGIATAGGLVGLLLAFGTLLSVSAQCSDAVNFASLEHSYGVRWSGFGERSLDCTLSNGNQTLAVFPYDVTGPLAFSVIFAVLFLAGLRVERRLWRLRR